MSKQEEIQIEQYLEGKMSPSEQYTFEEQMAANPALKERIEDLKLLYEGFEELQVQELQKEIAQWENESNTSKNKVSSLFPKYLAYAAAISLLMSTGLFIYAQVNFQNQLIAERGNIETDLDHYGRGEKNEINLALQEGIKALSIPNYEAAIRYFNTFQPDNKHYPSALYLLANTYFQSNSYEKAIETYAKLIDINDRRYIHQAEINLLMSYIAKGQFDNEFDQLMDKILQEKNHPFYEKAAQSKRELNSFWRKLVW